MTDLRHHSGFFSAALALILAVSFAASQTATTVPTMVKFSGTVQEAHSSVVGITFALYKEQGGGAPLWLETQSVPLDRTGHYSVQLGQTLPAGLPKDLFTSGEARWLGVQPEGQTEQPRILLLSVPYALKAADAETIGGLPPSAFVLAGKGTGGTTTTGEAPASSNRARRPPPPGPPTVTTNGGTPYTIPLFKDVFDIENSIITQSNGNIGINTAPATTLDVGGDATVRGILTATGTVGGTGYLIGSDLFAFGTAGSGNVFLGFAGNTTNLGFSNTATGLQALRSTAYGWGNTANGQRALFSNSDGPGNTASGLDALNRNTIGGMNTASGSSALYFNTEGYQNTAVGSSASWHNTTGNNNTALGYWALYNNTVASNSTAVGYQALFNNTTGGYNTGLGYKAGPDSTTTNLWNSTAIGAYADVTASNSLVLGGINGKNGATDDTNVGIATTAPTARLHIGSANVTSFRVEGPSQAGTSAAAASFGGLGNFNIDAPGIVGGRFTVKENGRVGIGTNSPDNTLSVSGTADKTGGGSWGTFSDRRLKDLQGNFNSGLRQVLRVNPIRYRYKEQNEMGIHDREEHIGLVAQEVQKLIPEAVTENSKGYLLVNNDPIIWAMLNAIKEQQQQIQQQRRQIRLQQGQIARLSGKVGVLESALQTTKQTRTDTAELSRRAGLHPEDVKP